MPTRRLFLRNTLVGGLSFTAVSRAGTESENKPYDSNAFYSMPAHFGGVPGGMTSTTYWDTDTVSVFYETDEAALSKLLPPGFQLSRPEVMIAAMMNRGVEWMGGEPYNILAVNVPCTFRGKAETVAGWFSLVVWEDNATPIISGRENTGIPKIPSEIEDFRFHQNQMRTWAHSNGHTFCDLHLTDIRTASAEEEKSIEGDYKNMNWMGWRYIPKVGAVGGAALSQATLFPQEFYPSSVSIATGKVSWSIPPKWKLPTQHHIIAQIAALPVGKALSPAVVLRNAKNVLRGDLARVLK